MLYLIYLPVLTTLLLMYFRFADQHGIIDKPNHRSSHSRVTIRGAGIIFPIALFIQLLISGFEYPFFTTGLALISLVSFYDDIRPLSNKIRLLVHVISVSLLFLETGLMGFALWILLISFILVIGTINAYNFMDGINGITGTYSLLIISSLYFINENIISFSSSDWLIVTVLSLVVFNFFNFRKHARCFAGDVGSVSIAFIIIFFLLQLILKTEDLKYIGFLLIYGLDSVSTIVFRLIRRENIFEAHRNHFYQYLTNVKGWPHLWVSALYLFLQFMLNVLIIYSLWTTLEFLAFILISGIVFVGIRLAVEGRENLMERKLENIKN